MLDAGPARGSAACHSALNAVTPEPPAGAAFRIRTYSETFWTDFNSETKAGVWLKNKNQKINLKPINLVHNFNNVDVIISV